MVQSSKPPTTTDVETQTVVVIQYTIRIIKNQSLSISKQYQNFSHMNHSLLMLILSYSTECERLNQQLSC